MRIALSGVSQTGDTGFSKYRFIHNALPEVDFDKIDTSVRFLGKKVNYPFFISCMTGGVKEGKKINRNLAAAAQKHNIAMGVGSQRAAVEHPKLKDLFVARGVAPDIPLLANVGLVQLNYGFGAEEFQKIVDMIDADALAIHINPVQEAIQPEGDRNWEGLLAKLPKVIKKISVPVIVKEVGFGLSSDVAARLYKAGVRIIDTAGWGGTSWAVVEGERRDGWRSAGSLFGEWGIPTSESIRMCAQVSKKNKGRLVVLGSGGIRTGVDVAKAISLGSHMVGIAAPFAQAAVISTAKVSEYIEKIGLELKIAMLGVGAKNITELRNTKLVTTY